MDMASMMAGMGGDKPNMDDLEDSDDEDLPDLEQEVLEVVGLLHLDRELLEPNLPKKLHLVCPFHVLSHHYATIFRCDVL